MNSPEQVVIDLMNETPAETETRRAIAAARRESYQDNERDMDLEEKRGSFRGVSRRNDAWDQSESDYC